MTSLYSKYMKYPKINKKSETYMKHFQVSGLTGTGGYMNACHIIIEKCAYRLKQNHLRGESKSTCQLINLTCNHKHIYFTQQLNIPQGGMTRQLFYMMIWQEIS